VADVPCELTSYQFDLLVALAERAGRVLSRDQIMEAVRGRELEAFDRSIDVHMGRIRAAIEARPQGAQAHPHRARRGLRVCAPARLTMFSKRLYVRIWLAVVLAVAVLTLLVGWAWRVTAEPPLARGGGARTQAARSLAKAGCTATAHRTAQAPPATQARPARAVSACAVVPMH